jgi:hypothetical protein
MLNSSCAAFGVTCGEIEIDVTSSRVSVRIDANRFLAAAYRNGERVRRGSPSLGGSTMGSESIEYSMTDGLSIFGAHQIYW